MTIDLDAQALTLLFGATLTLIVALDSGSLTESAYKADMRGVLDAIFGRWPTATVYWTHPWRGDNAAYDNDATTIKTWNNEVLAEYPAAYVGNDETVWFKNGIATYSSDAVHPNDAGCTEMANQFATAMGY